MNKTKVHFRKWSYPDYMESMKGETEVIALFPELLENNGLIESYMHIGQHSSASQELITELETATFEEYSSLAIELESIGYVLEILK